MNQFYAQAIDILVSPDLDYKHIVIELAKKHPDILVALAERHDEPEAWHKDVISYIKGNNRVNGIKLIRERTGFGLKEAKDVCDALIHAMLEQHVDLPFINDDNRSWYTSHGQLNPSQEKVYIQLCAAAYIKPAWRFIFPSGGATDSRNLLS